LCEYLINVLVITKINIIELIENIINKSIDILLYFKAFSGFPCLISMKALVIPQEGHSLFSIVFEKQAGNEFKLTLSGTVYTNTIINNIVKL
jgi:hypothetical protein